MTVHLHLYKSIVNSIDFIRPGLTITCAKLTQSKTLYNILSVKIHSIHTQPSMKNLNSPLILFKNNISYNGACHKAATVTKFSSPSPKTGFGVVDRLMTGNVVQVSSSLKVIYLRSKGATVSRNASCASSITDLTSCWIQKRQNITKTVHETPPEGNTHTILGIVHHSEHPASHITGQWAAYNDVILICHQDNFKLQKPYNLSSFVIHRRNVVSAFVMIYFMKSYALHTVGTTMIQSVTWYHNCKEFTYEMNI